MCRHLCARERLCLLRPIPCGCLLAALRHTLYGIRASEAVKQPSAMFRNLTAQHEKDVVDRLDVNSHLTPDQ
jgi:hypothetical protein